jgi:hypothetical protein
MLSMSSKAMIPAKELSLILATLHLINFMAGTLLSAQVADTQKLVSTYSYVTHLERYLNALSRRRCLYRHTKQHGDLSDRNSDC